PAALPPHRRGRDGEARGLPGRHGRHTGPGEDQDDEARRQGNDSGRRAPLCRRERQHHRLGERDGTVRHDLRQPGRRSAAPALARLAFPARNTTSGPTPGRSRAPLDGSTPERNVSGPPTGSSSVSMKPTGYSTVSPYLIVAGAQRVVDFLRRTFDGQELRR